LNTTLVGPAPTASNSTGFENSATENSPPTATDTIHNVASHAVENTLASQDVAQTTPNVHVETTPIVNVKPNDVAAGEKTDDVVMGDPSPVDTPAHKPQNDVNLPTRLAAMIRYLRGVAKDALWQNLVTEFVEFEKSGPPNGVRSLIIFSFESWS
jgi:hypothetical protein